MRQDVSRMAATRGPRMGIRTAAAALIALLVALAGAGSATARQEPFLVTPTFSDGFALSRVDTRAFAVAADELRLLSHDGATLEIDAGALSQASTIRISGLPAEELPRLDQGMTNVTGSERVGFRFLPHRKFDKQITVRLPYEPALIPPGSTAEDLRTFFFDEAAGKWEPLPRVAVDLARHEVVSHTDHFTDMINAAVTVPDHPAPVANTPDMFSKTEPARPTAKVNVIEPPAASNTGEAALTYPLELPSGRGRVQPSVAVRYSSGASNGWVGVGWDVAMRAITIDTRWGVPRYSEDVESETYVLEGKQLTPLAHRGAPRRRAEDRVFHTRVEGSFERIVRRGTSPSTYSWEVTDKQGTRYLYGGSDATTLTDPEGNVFKWALREIRDLNGNTIRYTYDRVSDPGMAGAREPGVQLYPKTIEYLGYTVTFVRDRELPGFVRRPDVLIDARGGFKMVTADLLERVEVRFEERLVRRYEFRYREGAFRKTLLASVAQFGADGSLFNEHRFDYYDDVREAGGSYRGFEPAARWDTGAGDGVTADLLGQGQASALGGSLTTAVGGHAYVGFSPAGFTKANSFGAKVGFNTSTNDGVLSLIDINGDSLPDKVFKTGAGVFFRLNRSGPDGGRTFGERRRIVTLGEFSRESASTFSAGLEAYALSASLMTNRASSSVVSSVYFADVNADGLLDVVADGQVRFNHPDADGIPTFDADSGSTPVRLPDGPGVDPGGLLPDTSEQEQAAQRAFPLHDVLRRWVAPFDGTVRIGGAVRLIDDTSAERDRYTSADGVRVAIQHNGGELWSERIEADDHAEKLPQGVDAIAVRKGDRIYFRTQSVRDGLYDQVAWRPRIEYAGASAAEDVNGLDPRRYDAGADFVLGGRRDVAVQMPVSGTVQLSGDFHKLGATTDDVRVEVLKNDDEVVGEAVGAPETRTVAIGRQFTVVQGDSIRLRVRVDSPIDLGQLRWTPRLVYVAADGGIPVVQPNGEPTIEIHPPYDLDMYPVDDLDAPQEPWRVPAGGSYTITPRVGADAAARGSLAFTVKRRGALLGKREVTIGGGGGTADPLTLDLQEGEEVFFDYSARDPELAARVGSTRVEISGQDDQPAALHSAAPDGLFPQPYRGWGAAGYDGDGARAGLAVEEARLRVPDRAEFERPECADRQAFVNQDIDDPRCNAARSTAFMFVPFPEEGHWRGPDANGWVGAEGMSSSRLGGDTIDLPRAQAFSGAQAPSKLSRTTQTAVQGGVAFLSGSISGVGPLDGTSSGALDFLDMNGDQFPDVVGTGRIQYTSAAGRLESANRPVRFCSAIGGFACRPAPGDLVRRSENEAFNFGVGGSAAFSLGNARGDVDAGRGAPKGNTTDSQMVSLGLSGGLGRGTSDVQTDLTDVNGDGLPDRVLLGGSQLQVALNLGYRFAEPEPWGSAAINAGGSGNGSIGASIGFNDGIYGFAGGASLTRSKSRTQTTLADVNGDGLIDRLAADGDELRVAFNTGNGFSDAVDWRGAPAGACDQGVTPPLSGIDWDRAHVCDGAAGLGGGAYFTIAIPIPFCTCSVIVNPGADAEQTMARPEGALRDTDGDGFPDYVASTDDGELSVATNTTGRTNLLKTIKRPLGAAVELSYERDGNTYEAPQSRWVLSQVEVSDGHAGDGDVAGRPTARTRYRYENGRYDRAERDFYGYARVTEEQRDPADDSVLRTVVRDYDTGSFYGKALLTGEAVLDGDGRRFTETRHEYVMRDVESGQEPADPSSLTATLFPMLVRTDTRWFEGQAAARKSTHIANEYDADGNVTRRFDAGDDGAADDLDSRLAYSDCPETHVVGTATRIVMRGEGRELRRREAEIDCATGRLTDVREYLENGDAAHTELDYFDNGNLRKVTGPPNDDGERFTIEYEYDDATAKYVTRARDSYGLASATAYDERFDAATTLTDPSGNVTTNRYDEFGRLIAVVGPYEQGGATPTLAYEYHSRDPVPWALTRRADVFRSAADTIDSAVLADGLGRVLQVKNDEAVNGRDVAVVSGKTTYDALGRATERFHPITEPLGSPGELSQAVDDVAPTRLVYDVLDRTTRTTLPDGGVSSASYDFGTDRDGRLQFERTDVDALGNRKLTYSDVRERVIATREPHTGPSGDPATIWTSYAYDPMGQLTAVHDDGGNTTTLEYDKLGRRTVTDNPDGGRVSTAYDLASNPIARVTANLRATGDAITYEYEFNRLTDVRHPRSPEIDAHYEYGSAGATDNSAGRIVGVSDQSGSERRSYGRLGEIVAEVKTVASDTQGNGPDSPETYTTRYRYDSFGRLQNLTYPDGELLTYRYDSGGNVQAVSGVKDDTTYPYVKRLEYDKFGQRSLIVAGNDTTTVYRHRPDNLRLENIEAALPSGQVFQDLTYEYDRVGNVLSATNDVAIPPPNEFGGPTTETYRYDDLYRLVGATGSYRNSPQREDRYSLDVGYDTLGNIRSKAQRHEVVRPSGNPIPQKATTYAWNYRYDGPQPHAATQIGPRAFAYDANGNQAGWESDDNGTRRQIRWDDENRLQAVRDNGHEIRFKYDDGGDRVVKRGPQGETVYVNRYFTIRNREVGTKHVWVESTRIASKLMKQDKPGANPSGNQPDERAVYFYHPDRAGSTNYVTDADGELFEHLEYFPFGEAWVEEATNTQRTPYRFTATELDEETGLYHNEARYYDPRNSQFISADPLTAASPEKLIGDPRLLSAYSRAFDNPGRYTDPTGLQPAHIGYVYVIRGTLNGQPVVYTGSTAQELRARFNSHDWKTLIRAEGTTVHAYEVRGELNIGASGRGNLASARNEALRAAEQRIKDRVERAAGVQKLNQIEAATPEHREQWTQRHNVRVGRGRLVPRGTIVRGMGALTLFDAFNFAREQNLSRYVMAPHVLEDENGLYTLTRETRWFSSTYRKNYVSGAMAGQQAEIDSDEFDFLVREAEALYGRVTWGGLGEWEPGLLRRTLPVMDPDSCEDVWGDGGPCA